MLLLLPFFFFLQHHMLYIELMSPAVEEWRSNHWTAWKLLKEKKGGGCFPGGTSGKESTCQCKRSKRSRVPPWVGKIPWRRKWQPTPAFLPGKSHGWRSLAGYSPKSHKELGTTERLSIHTFKKIYAHLYLNSKLTYSEVGSSRRN